MCRHELWFQCDRSNSNTAFGAAFGYTQLIGGYDGGRSEFVLVSFKNTRALKVRPDTISNAEEILVLNDILATGYFGEYIAHVSLRDDVAVFGAGLVGYFAVLSSF